MVAIRAKVKAKDNLKLNGRAKVSREAMEDTNRQTAEAVLKAAKDDRLCMKAREVVGVNSTSRLNSLSYDSKLPLLDFVNISFLIPTLR